MVNIKSLIYNLYACLTSKAPHVSEAGVLFCFNYAMEEERKKPDSHSTRKYVEMW